MFPFLAVSVSLGVAMWLSRAVLDVAGTGEGVRVAYLPSLPELAGLIVLSGLIVTLVHDVLGRLRARWWPAVRLDAPLLLPIGVLSLLALPFLPFVPDLAPALRLPAGPFGTWVWAVAAALVAWGLGERVIRPAAPARSRVVIGGAAVFLAAAAAFAGAAQRLGPGALYPGGDEPHYLVVTQSVLRDGDLRIDDNHARGDYREYYQAPLRPHHIVGPSEGGAIYSIHPIGVSLAVAPGFALAGYRGAALTIVCMAALAGLLLWLSLRNAVGSTAAATFGWLAVVSSAPFLLHSFAIYPEIPAALVTIAALAPGVTRERGIGSAAVRGVLIGLLPWLSTKYAPMSAVVLALVAWRVHDNRHRVAVVAPYAISVAAWLAWFDWIWGTPSPTAPYGPHTQMALWHLAAGVPGLFLDQEYGIVPVAPLFALVPLGWWHLWRRDADGRRLVLETALPLAALAMTVGAFGIWWGGSAPPGRELVAALPLLGVPLAYLWRHLAAQPVRRGVLVVLLAIGVSMTATFVLVHEGLLIANGRDGSAAMLEYLAPSRDAVRAAPSFVAHRDTPWRPLGVAAIWILAGAALWSAAGRIRRHHVGYAGLAAAALTLPIGLGTASLVPLLSSSFAPPRMPAERRVSADALDAYDATARPIALVYDPFRAAHPRDVTKLVSFAAGPGTRRGAQPLRVLLNTRLALPAGTYRVVIEPLPGRGLNGTVGLQVGRIGSPRETWTVDAAPGAAWETTFALDMDANFVGLRAGAEFEAATARLEIVPLEIVDAGRRLPRRPVLAAVRYHDVPVYFHDDHAYVEPTGFWARGRTSHELTVGIPEAARVAGVTLQLHSGSGDTRVRLSTPAWSDVVSLTHGHPKSIVVPALASQRLLPITITPESGFVPAELTAGVEDRRLLGCWVEVLP